MHHAKRIGGILRYPGAVADGDSRGARADSAGLPLADTVISDSPSAPGVSSPTASVGEPASLVGARIDHFQIEKLIGSGGMGAVYLARDVSLDRPVALKMMRASLAQPGNEERLMREARAQAKVQHPNVVGIHYIGRAMALAEGADETSAPLYFAMERVDGGTFEEIVQRGETLDPESARIAMLQVARGLRAALRKGIIHRDIKPSNLLRDHEGRVHIADFGLAKPVEGDVQITQEGAFIGSPLYMSPEQASGDPLDHRADMYSIGATFYHLVAGHPPFDGNSPLQVVSRHMSKPPPPLEDAAPRVPGSLRRIIHKLLEKKPEDRYDDYDDLIDAIQDAAPGRSPHAGFWIRVAAVMIDSIVAGLLIALLGWPGAIIHLVHVTVGHVVRGQTIGKYLVRIRVLRADGAKLGWGRSIARTLIALWMPIVLSAMILSTEGFEGLTTTIEQLRFGEMGRVQDVLLAILVGNGILSLLYGAGLALAAFHRQKKTVHDLLVDSSVRYVLPG